MSHINVTKKPVCYEFKIGSNLFVLSEEEATQLRDALSTALTNKPDNSLADQIKKYKEQSERINRPSIPQPPPINPARPPAYPGYPYNPPQIWCSTDEDSFAVPGPSNLTESMSKLDAKFKLNNPHGI